MTQADITVTCVFGFLCDALQLGQSWVLYPGLTALSARCEALPAFRELRAKFTPSESALPPRHDRRGSLEVREHLVHLVGCAKDHRRALVDRGGLHFQNRLLRPARVLPPACSMSMAMGLASYMSRSFPSGALRVGGYRNTPPFSRMRCTSATMAPA